MKAELQGLILILFFLVITYIVAISLTHYVDCKFQKQEEYIQKCYSTLAERIKEDNKDFQKFKDKTEIKDKEIEHRFLLLDNKIIIKNWDNVPEYLRED